MRIRALLLLLVLLAAGTVHAVEQVRIGVLAARPARMLEARWAPMSNYLEKAMPGRKVELLAYDDAELQRAVARNELDFVVVPPIQYLRIRENNALVRVVATLERGNGDLGLPVEAGVIVRLKERQDLAELSDLRGRSIASAGRGFLLNYVAQLEALDRAGVKESEFRVELVGLPHDRTLQALLSGKVDAAFLPAGFLRDAIAGGQVQADRLQVMGQRNLPGYPHPVSTRLYPDWAVLALQRASEATVNQLTAALLTLEEGHPAASSVNINGFTVPADYGVVEDLAREYRIPPFDHVPHVPWRVVWEQQRNAILLGGLLLVSLLLLSLALALGRRRHALLLESLAQQQATLHHVVQSVPGAVYHYRLVDGVRPELLFIGPQIETVWGVSADDAMRDPAANLFSRIHPADFPAFAEADRQATEAGTRFAHDFRIILPSGAVRWLHAESDPIDDERYGRTYFGYIHDITERKLAEADLRRVVSDKSATLAAIPDLLFELDAEGVYLSVLARDPALLPFKPNELLGRSAREVLPPAAAEVVLAALQGAAMQGHSAGQEIMLALPQGERWFELSTALKRSEDRASTFIMLARDVTERHRALATLQRLAGVFAHSAEAILVLNTHFHIVDVNPAFTQITGYTREEARGCSLAMLHVEPSVGEQAFQAELVNNLQVRGFWRGELSGRKKNGDQYPVMLSLAAVRNAAGGISEYIAIFADISRQKEHERELDLLANYDQLTALPNRHLLADRMQSALAHAQREQNMLAVCFLDLDGFKELNDTQGHEAGDTVLRQIARNLQDALRAGDTAARLGGDEFVLLLTSLHGLDELVPALDRVLAAASRPVSLGEGKIALSASIGVTVYPSDAADADTLIRHADQAMYRAKEMGKNRFCFFDTENARRVTLQQEGLKELERALSEREFVLYYQPKIALATGRVIGAEALIRWRHPVRGLVPPGEFLSMLEDSPLEIDFSEWVLETALAQLVQWQQQGLLIGVSANLPAAHLLQPNFAEWMNALLARHPKVLPNSFEIEILESAAIQDVDLASVVLEALCRQGVSVSLDDFGTGYSSLTYFRRLPVQLLKIDQGFVRDMLNDSDDRGIVDTVIRLSKVFQRSSIAEGVETFDHWAELLKMECDFGQGYGIARPMPAEDFPAWVAQWQAHPRGPQLKA